MERSGLNEAHRAARLASKAIQRGRIEDGISLHLKAARILYDLQLRTRGGCQEALKEQADFHQRQAQLSEVFQKFMEGKGEKQKGGGGMERKKAHGGNMQNVPKALIPNPDILRQLNEADSLLEVLVKRKPAGPAAGIQEERKQPDCVVRPKSEAEVIEELQLLNQNLRSIIDQLLTNIHELTRENRELKERLEEKENQNRDNRKGSVPAGNVLKPEDYVPDLVKQNAFK